MERENDSNEVRHDENSDRSGWRRESVHGSTYDRGGPYRETMSGRDYPGSLRPSGEDYRYNRGPYDPSGYDARGYGGRDYNRELNRGGDYDLQNDYIRGFGVGMPEDDSGRTGWPDRDVDEDWTNEAYGGEYGRRGFSSRRDEYERAGNDIPMERWSAPGPFTGRGPKGYQRTSEQIKAEVSERLAMHGQIDASDIEVNVENGEVTLEGTVDSRRTKRLAEDVAESVVSVKDVHNRLRIGRQTSQSDQTS
ncbi:MAG TPA: BON domain-containing protein [Rhodothermales bacterium]|nr:BON domain-containing protein [Rhodothermales bacterium]